MKVIGIVGTRRRAGPEDFALVTAAFDAIYEPGDQIVSGGCSRGGDAFAAVLASQRGIPMILHKADWRQGRSAGFQRNGLIARDADVLLACVAPDRTGGTEDTIRKFLLKPEHGPLVLV